MNKIFFLADTHWGHRKILEIRPFSTVEEMNEALVKNWNSTVQDDDIVFHLGDISFASRSSTREFLSQLRGHKHLILGNHDNQKISFYRQYFESVNYKLIFDSPTDFGEFRYVLSHKPISYFELTTLANLWGKKVINIHGHSHGTTNSDLRMDSLLHPNFYVEVCVENTDYKPICLTL